MAGGLLLAISLFLTCYRTDPGNPNADMFPDKNGIQAGSFSWWDSHTITRWILLLNAVAPFILAYIIVREHALSWPRGEVTMVTAIAALGFILYFGFIARPGDPSGAIGLRIGWFGMLLGSLLMLVGSLIRISATETKRKPPGVF
jgi:hypothetical protein